MKRFVVLAALAVALGAGMAQAQTPTTVRGIGMQGQDPASGAAPKQVVIFFHGYTQRGVAMKPLADALAKRLPDAAFVYNDGPLTANNGKSWYVLRGEDPENTKAASKQVAIDTVTKVSDGLKVPHDKIVVVGFSQGGGMAFDAGACVSPDVKAVVSLAGIVANGDCKSEGGAMPTLIVYNNGDPVVPVERITAFRDTLKAGGYTSTLETVTGDAHWPAADGLKKAEDFIVAQLGG